LIATSRRGPYSVLSVFNASGGILVPIIVAIVFRDFNHWKWFVIAFILLAVYLVSAKKQEGSTKTEPSFFLFCPLLAAVNGSGVGLGLTMLAHCDLVLIADHARLLAPFTAMGVAPEAASSYLLPIRMGHQQAALALYASRWITAAEAVDAGLALRACPAETLLETTHELAREIAAKPLASLLATKRLVGDAHREGILRARRLEDETFSELLRSPLDLG
jgi:uncharacterized membrane protein